MNYEARVWKLEMCPHTPESLVSGPIGRPRSTCIQILLNHTYSKAFIRFVELSQYLASPAENEKSFVATGTYEVR